MDNKLSYTSKIYESIYTDLINAIPSLTTIWTNREESDPGIVLVKLMAMVGDMLSYTLDKQALETFIATVQQPKNASKILELIGYIMPWYISARTKIILNVKDPENLLAIPSAYRIIPKYTAFASNDGSYTYTTTEEITLPLDATTVSINAVEGKINNIAGITVNTSSIRNNRYYFVEPNIDPTTLNITNNGYLWEQVSDIGLSDYIGLGGVYHFRVDDNSLPYIEFIKDWETRANESPFIISYILSSGANGSINANVLNKFYSNSDYSNYYNVSNERSSLGKDPETVNEARVNYKKYVNTFDTLVAPSDYEHYIKRNGLAENAAVIDSYLIEKWNLDPITADDGYSTANYTLGLYLALIDLFSLSYNATLSEGWTINSQSYITAAPAGGYYVSQTETVTASALRNNYLSYVGRKGITLVSRNGKGGAYITPIPELSSSNMTLKDVKDSGADGIYYRIRSLVGTPSSILLYNYVGSPSANLTYANLLLPCPGEIAYLYTPNGVSTPTTVLYGGYIEVPAYFDGYIILPFTILVRSDGSQLGLSPASDSDLEAVLVRGLGIKMGNHNLLINGDLELGSKEGWFGPDQTLTLETIPAPSSKSKNILKSAPDQPFVFPRLDITNLMIALGPNTNYQFDLSGYIYETSNDMVGVAIGFTKLLAPYGTLEVRGALTSVVGAAWTLLTGNISDIAWDGTTVTGTSYTGTPTSIAWDGTSTDGQWYVTVIPDFNYAPGIKYFSDFKMRLSSVTSDKIIGDLIPVFDIAEYGSYAVNNLNAFNDCVDALYEVKLATTDFKHGMAAYQDWKVSGVLYLTKAISIAEGNKLLFDINAALQEAFKLGNVQFGKPVDYSLVMETIYNAAPALISRCALDPITYTTEATYSAGDHSGDPVSISDIRAIPRYNAFTMNLANPFAEYDPENPTLTISARYAL